MRILRKIGDKGQMTIPKEVRDLLGIEQGDVVQLEVVAVYTPENGNVSTGENGLRTPEPKASNGGAS